MLTNFNDMLGDAYKNGYAVGSFNAYNYETIRGIIEAGRSFGSKSVIVAFGYKYLVNMELDDVVAVTKTLADRSGLSVCLHLDHTPDVPTIFKAIRAGFGSVMYDGSALPFAENLANTKLVCDVAHASGVSVEAELGSLAAGEHSHEGSADDREVYTSPEQAAQFIKETGVDALAVSIGTVHGVYKGEPNIRIDILQEINAACGIPLVLHGGSGVPEETIRETIKNGISKINVNTEISMYAVDKLKAGLAEGKPHLSVLSKVEEEAVREVVEKYMAFFQGR